PIWSRHLSGRIAAGLRTDSTCGNPGGGRSGDSVASGAGSLSERAVRVVAVGVPCDLGLRSSILMKQKNMLPLKTLLKNLPRKTGGGQGVWASLGTEGNERLLIGSI